MANLLEHRLTTARKPSVQQAEIPRQNLAQGRQRPAHTVAIIITCYRLQFPLCIIAGLIDKQLPAFYCIHCNFRHKLFVDEAFIILLPVTKTPSPCGGTEKWKPVFWRTRYCTWRANRNFSFEVIMEGCLLPPADRPCVLPPCRAMETSHVFRRMVKWIAFTGRQYGMPCFIIPAEGGEVKQLTGARCQWWSERLELGFKSIYFTSGRIGPRSPGFTVNLRGNTPQRVLVIISSSSITACLSIRQ